ncbi:MAG: hypothetical protein KDD64_13620 [Bdellovibrionales bacterium]|nr:hypothetical protein [Bdellovibrionales bacterium]
MALDEAERQLTPAESEVKGDQSEVTLDRAVEPNQEVEELRSQARQEPDQVQSSLDFNLGALNFSAEPVPGTESAKSNNPGVVELRKMATGQHAGPEVARGFGLRPHITPETLRIAEFRSDVMLENADRIRASANPDADLVFPTEWPKSPRAESPYLYGDRQAQATELSQAMAVVRAAARKHIQMGTRAEGLEPESAHSLNGTTSLLASEHAREVARNTSMRAAGELVSAALNGEDGVATEIAWKGRPHSGPRGTLSFSDAQDALRLNGTYLRTRYGLAA